MTATSSNSWWDSELPAEAAAESHTFVVHVRAGIGRKKPLFEELSRVLRLPDYCGHNWDALEEVLRDFAWLGDVRTVWLVHADIPFSKTSQNRATYLSILKECVAHGLKGGAVRLRCVFPRSPDE